MNSATWGNDRMTDQQPEKSTSSFLASRDYQLLLSVLEDAADAADLQFFDQLREALARHLGWTDSVIVGIPSEIAPFPPRSIALRHLHTSRSTSFLEEYLDSWLQRNPFKTTGAGLLLAQTGAVSLADLHPHSTEAEWGFIDKYLRRHGISDVLYGCIQAGSDGSALICRYVSDDTDIDERDRALMKLLTRHLSPRLSNHFSRVRKITDAAALTEREIQVVALVARGMTNRQIADELAIRLDTVKKHVMLAMKKTGTDNRTQLALIHLGR